MYQPSQPLEKVLEQYAHLLPFPFLSYFSNNLTKPIKSSPLFILSFQQSKSIKNSYQF